MVGYLFRACSKNWNELRLFAFHTRTFFEISFIIIYTLEQALLVYWGASKQLSLPKVSYFVLLVLFTFAIHKIVMESRMRMLDDKVAELRKDKKMLETQMSDLEKEFGDVSNVRRQRKI